MILVAAATPWETRPLEAAFKRHRGRILVVEMGVGPKKAASVLKDIKGVKAALSAGFAGSLKPSVRPGDLVVDLRAAPAAWGPAARRAASRLGAVLHLGPVASSDHVVGKGEKRTFDDSFIAVDMESESVRAWSSARGIPFMAAKVILDAAGERMPAGVPDGAGAGDLARYVLRSWRKIPALARLALRQKPAMRRLGAFLINWLDEVGFDDDEA
ncbi:MAG: hypothetical protein HY922_02440 [Elusimicrobia bacterium]|nr:hypothetical protein [Elusimicrobiota bacterium]